MAILVLARTFLERYAGLSSSVQKDVRRLLDKFDELSRTKSLHLEPISGALDPFVRTVRVNQSVRGIVAAPERGETFVLVDVLPHDDAIAWCRRRRLTVNHTTGALEVYDVAERGPASGSVMGPAGVHDAFGVGTTPGARNGGFFAARTDDEFVQVGIDRILLPAVRAVKNEGEVEALAATLPSDQAQALLMLAAGYSVDAALAELLTDRIDKATGDMPARTSDPAQAPMRPQYDPTDIAAAAQRPASGASFYVVESAAALVGLLNRPLELWRVFLHPSQRRLAFQPRFDGPVRVLGGPGTGKTVVALHRAQYLAERLPPDGKVLLTTFTKGLAGALERQLVSLAGEGIRERVDVVNVDALAYQVVQRVEGSRPQLADGQELRAWFAHAAAAHGASFHADFLRREWEQVILAQGITSREAYFVASRAGRGIRLDRKQRALVWAVLTDVIAELAAAGQRTHLQLAHTAAQYLSAQQVPRYVHVVVDEVQDLHPAQWRLLRAAVPSRPNDLFLAGDPHQRIYDNRVTLFSLGIDVRGRGYKLRLNYRMTYENLRWSLGLLAGTQFDDLDGSADDLRGYRSQLRGPAPTLAGYATPEAERVALAEAIRSWSDAGVPFHEVGVAVRTIEERRAIAGALRQLGICAVELTNRDAGQHGAVHVGTMHGMKGLEYRCLAVSAVREGLVPLPAAITDQDEDELQHAHDVQRERSLLFVACTRARDWLRVSWSGQPSRFLSPLLAST